MRKGGFINYFGLQRFGTSAVGTHEIGRALLQSDWTLATELILSPRPGEAPDVAAARAAWADGQNAKEALTRMPRRAVAERALLEAFAKEGGMTDKLGAIARIPKNLRLMYVHAYQSALWNKSVSERVRLYGAGKPVVGDLVLLEGSGDEEVDMDVDNDDADKRRGNGPMTVSDAVRLSKVAKVKALDEQDLASGAYSIEDVVMPLPGFAVEYPAGPVGQLYRSLMRDDGLDPDDMFRKQKDFSMVRCRTSWRHMSSQLTSRRRVARTARLSTSRRMSRIASCCTSRPMRTLRRRTRTPRWVATSCKLRSGIQAPGRHRTASMSRCRSSLRSAQALTLRWPCESSRGATRPRAITLA